MTDERSQTTCQDRYMECFQGIPADIRKCLKSGRRIVLGYTSNLDVIIEWNSETIDDILSTYLRGEPSLVAGDVIDSIESFARIACYYMVNGLGGEIDITASTVCEYLERRFTTVHVLGGTCAQGAAALSAVGFPVLVHITDRSGEVCSLMDRPGVSVVAGDRVVPIMGGMSGKPPVRHMILQYTKGSRTTASGVIYTTPASNRLIMDFDTIHKLVPIDEDFLNYCETHARDMRAYGVSGFNGILDPAIAEKRTEELAAHYREVKNRNPDCTIYLEDAHYLNFNLKERAFSKLAKVVDIIGMNEEEFADHTEKLGFTADKDELASVLGGLDMMFRRYSMRGIVMHTKDYSLYYGKRIGEVDFAKGLTLGNLLAATRARTGRYGTYEDCGETLSLPQSPRGLAFLEQLARMETKEEVILVPTFYMERPTYTIGLGDSFMGGFLISLTG